MTSYIEITRSTDEGPVPTEWRRTFFEIIEAFRRDDFGLDGRIVGVGSVAAGEADRISKNISSYGDKLVGLPEETWNTSICRRMDGYWSVMIDLFTVREGASDLVLFCKVYEDPAGYRFEIDSVHVP